MGDLSGIASWSYTQFMAVGVVIAAIYYFTLYDAGDNLVPRTQQAKATLTQKKAELEKILKAQIEKERTQDEMNVIAEQFKEILQFLPTEFNQAELMRDVIEEARVAGARNIRIQPEAGQAEKSDFYDSLLINISFDATFAQTMGFLSALTKIPRIINIKRIELSSRSEASDQPMLGLSVVLAGYRYVDRAKADAPAPGGRPAGGH